MVVEYGAWLGYCSLGLSQNQTEICVLSRNLILTACHNEERTSNQIFSILILACIHFSSVDTLTIYATSTFWDFYASRV